MANNLADFAQKISAQTTPSGAVFRSTLNSDGSLTVFRAASATSGVWSVYHSRIIYTSVSDTVSIGDGSDIAIESSAAYIAGLN